MGYKSDLTEKQWEVLEPVFKNYLGKYGNRAKHKKQDLVNAVLYVTKTGCQWRMLPNDFPPWKTVYGFFRRMRDRGIWEQINDLVVRKTREGANRSPNPTYALIDSQSVKTTSASVGRGIDGGKKGQGS